MEYVLKIHSALAFYKSEFCSGITRVTRASAMNLALTTVAVAITLAVMTYLGGMETSLHAQFRDDDAKLNNGEKLAVVDMQMRSVQADVASMRSDMRNVQEEVRQLRQIAAVRDGQLQLVQQTLGFLGIAGCIQIGLLLFKIFGNSKPAP